MKTPILLLHGWAKDMTGSRYAGACTLLEKAGYTVFAPDLPGFGNNPLPQAALVFEDYIVFVKTFIEKTMKAKKVILIGHSFGGRMAIRFSARYPDMVEKLILADASGVPQKLTPKKQVLSLASRMLKPLFVIPPFSFFFQFARKILYRTIGEMDYYKAGNLTQTFKNVYQVSIMDDLPKVSAPTLIVWGEKDMFTPIQDGKIMHEGIKNAKFAIIQDASHKLPYEKPTEFVKEVISFLS